MLFHTEAQHVLPTIHCTGGGVRAGKGQPQGSGKEASVDFNYLLGL